MADYKVETMRAYKIIGAYDDTNGDTVKNETNVDYAGVNANLTGWWIEVGLTTTDGHTIDIDTIKRVNVGETVSFESGLGAGRNIIVLEKQENRSTFETRTDIVSLNA